MIFEALQKNAQLKVFDLSYNSIGNHHGSTTQLCTLLRLYKNLVHVDLSWNNFTYQECIKIGRNLEHNHTLLGFHFDGHYSHVDHLGFLQPNKATRKQTNTVKWACDMLQRPRCPMQKYPIPHWASNAFKEKSDQSLKIEGVSAIAGSHRLRGKNCWICEG